MSKQAKRPVHPRDLICPQCGAGAGRPCVFAGKEQELVHCTERLLAIGDASLRVKPPAATKKKSEKKPPKSGANRRPLPGNTRDSSPTLF